MDGSSPGGFLKRGDWTDDIVTQGKWKGRGPARA